MALESNRLGADRRCLRWCGRSASVAAVNLTLWPETGAIFQRAGMLSVAGRCQALDAAADGYVR